MQLDVYSLLLAGILVFFVSRVRLLYKYRAVSVLPGLRLPCHILSFPGAFYALYTPWKRRFDLYKSYGSDTISLIPYLSGNPTIYTANIDVARQVVGGGHRSSFHKPEAFSRSLLIWGMNLAAAEGETWRKHRRIMGPAFNSALYDFVWEKTAEIYKDMVSCEGWNGKNIIEVPVIQRITFKLALLVLSTCGFGFPFTWSSPPNASDGSMSVLQALTIFGNSTIITIMPKKYWNIPLASFRNVKHAFRVISDFMYEKARERKNDFTQDGGQGTKRDALSMLVAANEAQDGKLQLDDTELISNVYLMLFAGHETTAHTLAASLGYLSINPEIQAEVYEQIQQVIGSGTEATSKDYPKLDKVLAVFYEALRMFPAGWVMIRRATEDAVLHIPNSPGEEGGKTIPVPKGVDVIVDMIGAQYNDRYFDEPEKFKPQRWYGLGTNDVDQFTAFSIGPRACIGRKFATMEAVSFLTHLLNDFRVEPLLSPGETMDQWKERVLQAKIAITLGCCDVPLRFVRREPLAL